MSATLGTLLQELQPKWSIHLFERLNGLAQESSNPWNNAGTGHSALCELNYMPNPDDPSKAIAINTQFQVTRQLWTSLVDQKKLTDPRSFISPTPHMTVVFGAKDVEYLRKRHATLVKNPLFSAMEFTDDPEKIAEWTPLLMKDRKVAGPMAATRYVRATDVDFGSLTKHLVAGMQKGGAVVHLQHEVISLKRRYDGLWHIRAKDRRSGRTVSALSRFVFVGAGGYALKLLRQAKLPEVKGYAVFPIGGEFYRTDNQAVVSQHNAKVYSQAEVGAPPMSVPHLDKRVVDGKGSLLFGPYATFSTKFLKNGRLTDLFFSIRPDNLPTMLAVAAQNFDLMKYLVGQLLATPDKKFKELQKFMPSAKKEDWYLIEAGQRAQLMKPDKKKVGVLQFGTELITGADGTIAGLLGASPGASTAAPIMLELLERCFPTRWHEWKPKLAKLISNIDTPVGRSQESVDENLDVSDLALGLIRNDGK